MKKEDLEKFGIRPFIFDMEDFRKKVRAFDDQLFLLMNFHKEEKANIHNFKSDMNDLGIDVNNLK